MLCQAIDWLSDLPLSVHINVLRCSKYSAEWTLRLNRSYDPSTSRHRECRVLFGFESVAFETQLVFYQSLFFHQENLTARDSFGGFALL
jgi:hypothetical protein